MSKSDEWGRWIDDEDEAPQPDRLFIALVIGTPWFRYEDQQEKEYFAHPVYAQDEDAAYSKAYDYYKNKGDGYRSGFDVVKIEIGEEIK